MTVARELTSKRLGSCRRRPCSRRGHLTLPGASSRASFVFFVDLIQAAIKSPHSPLEISARQDGEQFLRELGIARDGHTGLFEDSLRPTRSIGKRE
jgi:hypothetical protein